MKKIFIAFLALLMVSFSTIAKTPIKPLQGIATKIPIDPKVKTGILSNGITYYIRQNPKPAQKVSLRLVVKAGSILENDKQLGLAHFMEHMNFNGSKNFKKNELVSYLQSIGVKFGAHLNAYTGFDETVYILPIPVDDDEKLEKGFQILEDWAFNASLDSEEISKEKGVVLEEYRLGLGAEKRMLQKYLPVLMHNSRYAKRLPIGTKKNLETFNDQDLKNFYKDWYRPDLMCVIAVGDIDVNTLAQKIKNHFEKYPAKQQPKKRKAYTLPNHEQTLISIETDKEASKSTVQLFYKDVENTKPIVNTTDYKNYIINYLFSSMLNDRLEELKNVENPPFIYGYATHTTTWAKSKSAFKSYALCSENGQLNALKTLVTENERIIRYGFTQGELARAKKKLLSYLQNSFNEKDKTESSTFASNYVQHFLNKAPIPSIGWELKTLKKILPSIQVANCNKLTDKYIHNHNRVIVLTGPEKKELNAITKADVLRVVEDVKNTKLKPYVDKVFKDGLMKQIPKKGDITKITKDMVFDITTLHLSNGAKVVYKRTAFKDNEILFSAFKHGGTSLHTIDEVKKTDLIKNILTEAGINKYSKDDLHKLLAGKTVSVVPFISDLSVGFSGSCSPKEFETLFQLTHLHSTQLNYDVTSHQSYINKVKAYYKNISAEPTTFFNIAFSKFLNQENKRYIGFPDEDDWKNTSYKLAYQKYQELFSNANGFYFYFVGNFDEQQLRQFSKTYLASLPNLSTKTSYQNVAAKPLKGLLEKTIVKGTAPKSMVKIIYQGLTDNGIEDAYYLKSLGDVLTIKLVEILREDASGVYGVSATGNMDKLPFSTYYFDISFPCGPENVAKLKQKTFDEIERIKKHGISPKDLNKIKQTQLLGIKEAKVENSYWIGAMYDSDFNTVDINKILDMENKIKQLSSKKIQYIAQKYLTKNRIIGVLMPEK